MKGKYLRMMRENELGPYPESGPYPQVDLLIQRGREVARTHLLPTLIVALALAGFAGLGAAVADRSVSVLAANTVPGLYELSFDTTGPVPLTNNRLPVGQELVLKAHVQDTSGNPAQRGEVIFQDCEVKNSPGPSAACDSGSGVWAHVFQMSVDASGNALVDYGFISIPETIGFRFRYIGQGSGIANGVSKSGDVIWF